MVNAKKQKQYEEGLQAVTKAYSEGFERGYKVGVKDGIALAESCVNTELLNRVHNKGKVQEGFKKARNNK
jgi:flagellar biosynthesis/type III secretory pathway protein FliH